MRGRNAPASATAVSPLPLLTVAYLRLPRPRSFAQSLDWPAVLLWTAIVAYAATFATLTLLRFYAFEARALDMGNLDQTVWNTAHGRWFHLTNQAGTVNRLSLHVEPILIPISWLYWVYSGPPTLLVLQAVTVALGAWPVYALARRQLAHRWAALAFALAFLLHPTIQAANWLEFHPVTLAPTFLLAAFYFLVSGRPGRYALFAVLAAACKEEIGLLVFMLGAYALIVRRRRQLGLITMALSLSWALVAVLGIQQLFAAGNIHWGRYDYLGDDPVAMATALLTRPDLVWAQLRAAHAGRYLAQLLWPTGFLALLAPEVLLLALPSLAINLLADFAPMHEVYTLIYAAPVLPFVLAASIMGAARIRAWVAARRLGLAPWVAPVLGGGALVCAVIAQAQFGYLPGGGNYLPLTVTDHHRRAAAIIAQIGPDAAVSAQDRLVPHVSSRETVYIFPRVEDADTVFVDVTGPSWPQHPNDLAASIDDLLAQGFGVATADDGYLLLRRDAPTATFPPTFFDAWRRPGYTPPGPPVADFDGGLQLLNVAVTINRYGELVTETVWLPQAPLDRDLRFYVAYLAPDGTTLQDTGFYQPVNVLWYPTSQWEPGVPVAVTTLPWSPTDDRFTLVVGLYDGANWAESERLAVVPRDPALPVLDGGTLLRLGGFRRERDGWVAIPVDPGPLPVTLDVRLGDSIRLTGADVPAAVKRGDDLTWTLRWQATAPVPFDYTAFVHLLDDQGEKATQLDWQPHDTAGLLPATAWPVGRPVVDTQTLPLPADLPSGTYRLIVGLYNWQDGVRLPVQGDHTRPDDTVDLGLVRVE